jgi:hypothetical protein
MRYIDLPDNARAFIVDVLADGEPGFFTERCDDDVPPWFVGVTIDDDGHWIEYWEGTDYDDTPTTLYEPGRKGWDLELLWEGESPRGEAPH